MAAEPTRQWSKEQLQSDDVTKKEIIVFLQENASEQFLSEFNLMGNVKSVAKSAKKEKMIKAYNHLFETKRFKGTECAENVTQQLKDLKVEDAQDKVKKKKPEVTVSEEPPKYSKTTLHKGDKINFPKKGDTVHCWYTGMLEDGTVFDSNIASGSKKKKVTKPLSFKVGVGKVIRGWDEALLTMSKGEKAQLQIESEWGYGKKGQPEAKIPPNAKLIFEVELVDIE
ncbi:peptidyl-prolyl cis-trans isomerase FKBP3 [Narcine bancroftii]|uniref:peptidyl-prolyl cis-trans isomerase FKBP3 n=1 Tax=Narcine bancroftii TaxID=1343680 RepID=UPI003830FF9B